MDDGLDYKTGYGKPPKRTQFQKGVSGNPKGRPKGSQNLATLFRKITYEKVRVNGPRGPRWMTKLEAGITQLVNRAATGDPKATRELIHWITPPSCQGINSAVERSLPCLSSMRIGGGGR